MSMSSSPFSSRTTRSSVRVTRSSVRVTRSSTRVVRSNNDSATHLSTAPLNDDISESEAPKSKRVRSGAKEDASKSKSKSKFKPRPKPKPKPKRPRRDIENRQVQDEDYEASLSASTASSESIFNAASTRAKISSLCGCASVRALLLECIDYFPARTQPVLAALGEVSHKDLSEALKALQLAQTGGKSLQAYRLVCFAVGKADAGPVPKASPSKKQAKKAKTKTALTATSDDSSDSESDQL